MVYCVPQEPIMGGAKHVRYRLMAVEDNYHPHRVFSNAVSILHFFHGTPHNFQKIRFTSINLFSKVPTFCARLGR